MGDPIGRTRATPDWPRTARQSGMDLLRSDVLCEGSGQGAASLRGQRNGRVPWSSESKGMEGKGREHVRPPRTEHPTPVSGAGLTDNRSFPFLPPLFPPLSFSFFSSLSPVFYFPSFSLSVRAVMPRFWGVTDIPHTNLFLTRSLNAASLTIPENEATASPRKTEKRWAPPWSTAP